MSFYIIAASHERPQCAELSAAAHHRRASSRYYSRGCASTTSPQSRPPRYDIAATMLTCQQLVVHVIVDAAATQTCRFIDAPFISAR